MSLKEKQDGVSLRTLYVCILAVSLIISAAMFYLTFSQTRAIERLAETTEKQIDMEKAAYELMDASDYLTECVQRFTVDGDTAFLDGYYTEAYDTRRREDAIEKMSGDSDLLPALKQLKEAMDDSVKLMDREWYAMRLVCEAKNYDIPEYLRYVELSDEDSKLSADDKMKRASQMVLGNEYYAQKDRIRISMRESLYELETITRNNQTAALANLKSITNYHRIIIVVQVLMMFGVVILTVSLCIKPILNAVDRIRSDRPIREKGAVEFKYLARAYNSLTVDLNEENELLKDMSQTDALTGIRNRMALRNDYPLYHDREVTVMMLDLDNFKVINDSCGHEEGDRILSETGRLLAKTFNKEHCYRYGGDEFLMIIPDLSEEDFLKKRDHILNNCPSIKMDGVTREVGYSVGYVHTVLNDTQRLRDLFYEADQNMYREKRSKKNEDPNT